MRTRHERLVTFFGHGTNEKGERFLVMELMESSLDRLLWGRQPWRLVHRLIVLVDVASALTYLHHTHKSLHLDLKSSNCLVSVDPVTNSFRAKLSDFGASKIVLRGKKKVARGMGITKALTMKLQLGVSSKNDMLQSSSCSPTSVSSFERQSPTFPVPPSLNKSASSKKRQQLWTKRMIVQGTVEWMAPEILRAGPGASAEVGPSVDMYAFGILLTEVMSQSRPWTSEEDVEIPGHGDRFASITRAVLSGKRPRLHFNVCPEDEASVLGLIRGTYVLLLFNSLSLSLSRPSHTHTHTPRRLDTKML